MTQLDLTQDDTIRQAAPGWRAGNGRHAAPQRQGADQPRAREQDTDGGEEQKANVGDGERTVSVAAGAIVALLGLSRGSLPGLLIAGVGGALIYRGAAGHCPAYQALGFDTAHQGQGAASGEGLLGRPGDEAEEISERGVHVEQAFQINRPAEQLYRYWRDFSNLPRIMSHLERVEVRDERRSHWVARAQVAGGRQFEWDAEITHDEPNTLIGWRSLPGADIDNAGQIRFSPAIGDRGTDVRVFIDYVPPAGRLGHWVASLLGQNPRRVVREDLRNFKRVMEIGEIPTLIGQPHGTCRGQGERYSESEWKPLFT